MECLQSYKIDAIKHADIEAAFVAHTQWSPQKPYPVIIENSKLLEAKLKSDQTHQRAYSDLWWVLRPSGPCVALRTYKTTV